MNVAAKMPTVPELLEPASLIFDSLLGANPFVELNRNEIIQAYTELATTLMARPERLWSYFTHLAADLVSIAAGTTDFAPEPSDRRFSDPTWDENAIYRRVRQSYLAWRQAAYGLLAST